MSRRRGTRPSMFAAPRLEDVLGRENGFGILRLTMALAVICAHSMPLGLGLPDLGHDESRGQTNVGGIAVCGFFVISGLLITRSGMRLTPARYGWNRAIRIFPAFWVCLALTAFVMAPLVAYHQGRLDSFWSHPAGPWEYLEANWTLATSQLGISGLLDHNPHPGVFNGALWSLPYEVACYIAVAVLAGLGILQRARWLVFLAMVAAYAWLVSIAVDFPGLRAPQYASGGLGNWNLPMLGLVNADMFLILAFMFGLGALAELYRHRVRMNGLLALLALVVFVATFHYGGLTVFGLPAFAYLVVYLAARMPWPLTRVGSKVDLSYGVYIYGFPAQQGLALLKVGQHGYAVFTALSLALAVVAAFFSWHLIEKPALKLKNLSYPHLPWRTKATGPEGPVLVTSRQAPLPDPGFSFWVRPAKRPQPTWPGDDWPQQATADQWQDTRQ
ncbi:acyltransferase family protein [Kitasatospora sp. NPDC096147]|uniref:acyltransferase family protein n=1 Tax=Kitasatospora sp. NPDC096147 TaxID=3364093 RepID=UPI003812B0BB